jgi:hypothetical protein
MALYSYTPAGDPGSAPAGLTPFGESIPGDWTIQMSGGLPAVQAYRATALPGCYGASLDALVGDPHSDAIEVRGRFRGDGGGLCFVRGSGAAGAESCVFASLGHTLSRRGALVPALTVGEWIGGSEIFFIAATYPWLAGPTYQFRFRAVGSHVQLKVWPDGTAEPGAWTMDTMAAFDVLEPGRAGIFNTNITSPDAWGAFSIGTGGDPAPALP